MHLWYETFMFFPLFLFFPKPAFWGGAQLLYSPQRRWWMDRQGRCHSFSSSGHSPSAELTLCWAIFHLQPHFPPVPGKLWQILVQELHSLRVAAAPGTADKGWAMPAVSLPLSLAAFIIPALSRVQMWSLACIPPLIPASSCLQLIRDSRASLGWHPDQGFDPFPAALGWEVRMWLTGIEFCSPEDSLPPFPCFGDAGGSQNPIGCSRMILRIAWWRSQGYLRLSAPVCRVSYE